MSQEVYLGFNGVMVKSLRWGMALWSYLFGLSGYSPYICKFFGVIFFLCAAFFMCCIFFYINKSSRISVWAYTFFSAVFITFPLINEIWEYNGANAYVSGNLMIVMFTILLQLCSKKSYWFSAIISGVLLTIVASSYETAIFVYISVVLSLLFYKFCVLNKKGKKRGEWFFEGLRYVPPLVFSVVLKFIIGYFLLIIQHLSFEPKGNININWGDFSLGRMIYLFVTTIDKFFLLVNYFPIYLFLLSIILFVILQIKYIFTNKSLLPIVIGLLLIISLFSVSVIRLAVMENRTAQTLNYFVAFVVFLASYHVCRINRTVIKVSIMIIFALITTWQSSYLCQVLEWNNQRSENEITIVRNLGLELSKNYKDKEIVFCGEYYIGDYLNERVTNDSGLLFNKLLIAPAKYLSHHKDWYTSKYIDTNVESNLNWSLGSTSIHPMKRLFSYCGYDLNIREIDSEEQIKYNTYAKENNMKTFEIKDIGECVLVYLGPEKVKE